MKKLLAICVSASVTLIACQANTPSTLIQPGQAPISRSSALPTGVIKGQLVLPYRVQTTSRLAKAGYQLLAYVAGQPAQAEETAETPANTETTAQPSAEPTPESTTASPAPTASPDSSGPLTESEVENLTATVDGVPVDLNITEVTPSETSEETTVAYEIVDAPDGEGLEVVEIQTPEGETVGGAIVEVSTGETVEQNITPETTSLLETAVEIHGSMKIADLTEADLEKLELDPALLNKQASLRSILKKDGTLKPNKARKFKQKDPEPSASPSTNPSASTDPSASPSASADPSASPSAEPSTEPSTQPSASASAEAASATAASRTSGNGKSNGNGKSKGKN